MGTIILIVTVAGVVLVCQWWLGPDRW